MFVLSTGYKPVATTPLLEGCLVGQTLWGGCLSSQRVGGRFGVVDSGPLPLSLPLDDALQLPGSLFQSTYSFRLFASGVRHGLELGAEVLDDLCQIHPIWVVSDGTPGDLLPGAPRIAPVTRAIARAGRRACETGCAERRLTWGGVCPQTS